MKWLEIILLRTAGTAEKPGYQLAQIGGSLSAPGLSETRLYEHASIPGDVALALRWDTKEANARGSDLALGLMPELKHLGLVDHSVWIEMGKRVKGKSKQR